MRRDIRVYDDTFEICWQAVWSVLAAVCFDLTAQKEQIRQHFYDGWIKGTHLVDGYYFGSAVDKIFVLRAGDSSYGSWLRVNSGHGEFSEDLTRLFNQAIENALRRSQKTEAQQPPVEQRA